MLGSAPGRCDVAGHRPGGGPPLLRKAPSACRCCMADDAVPHLRLWGRQPPGGHQQHHRHARGGDQGVLAGGRPGRRGRLAAGPRRPDPGPPRGWAPSTASPTSASRWRPGSSTPTTTGSACSNSTIPVCGPTAPQPAPGRPTSPTSRNPRRRRASRWPMPLGRSPSPVTHHEAPPRASTKPSSWAPAAAPGTPSDKETQRDDRAQGCRP